MYGNYVLIIILWCRNSLVTTDSTYLSEMLVGAASIIINVCYLAVALSPSFVYATCTYVAYYTSIA